MLCYQRKCVVEELRQRPEEDLDGISPWFAAELPYEIIHSKIYCINVPTFNLSLYNINLVISAIPG